MNKCCSMNNKHTDPIPCPTWVNHMVWCHIGSSREQIHYKIKRIYTPIIFLWTAHLRQNLKPCFCLILVWRLKQGCHGLDLRITQVWGNIIYASGRKCQTVMLDYLYYYYSRAPYLISHLHQVSKLTHLVWKHEASAWYKPLP